MIDLFLQPGREKQILRGHPWVFARAIRDLDAAIPPGTVARILSSSGEFLGVGYVNPRCAIAVRICSRIDRPLDRVFFADRLRRASQLRAVMIAEGTNVYRLVNGEGDFLPGFVVDRFGDTLVMQCLTAGADALRSVFVDGLRSLCDPRTLIDQSRGSVRKAEGLGDREEVLVGEAAAPVTLKESGLRVVVVPGRGQKTGYFCDQRDNRRRLRGVAKGRRVLDAFCYSGGFAASAALGGAARVVAVDSSRDALDLAAQTLAANALSDGRVELKKAKVADYLRATEETFDAIVLDPPPLVRRRNDLRQGMRAYRDLNLWAMRRLAEGGVLFTFTCSQHVDAETFRRAVVDVAVAAQRDLQILAPLGPGVDHPVAAGHVEGEYLRGLLVRVGGRG